jgi:hypothetical protein
MSAAADDPHGAAVRVSVVSSIGYTAFLAGPPLIGLLAEPERWGILSALLVTLVALVVGGAVAGQAAPPAATAGAEAGAAQVDVGQDSGERTGGTGPDPVSAADPTTAAGARRPAAG